MKSRLEQLRPLDEGEIGALPPLTWLIDQHLPENGLGVIYGAPKSGKTFVAVSMACAVASGVPWLGHEVPAANQVVYIYAEGWRSTHKRVLAWKQHNGIAEMPFFFAIPTPVAITDERDLSTMVEAILGRGLHPGLIVIDTLARCFGGLNENSTQDMSKFVESCDSLRSDAFPGSTVLVVHHSGKDDARGARGSSALLGAVDVEWEVCKGETYNHLIFRNTAQKEREEFEPRDMEKFDIPGTGSATVRWSGEPISARPRAHMQTVRALERFGEEGATWTEWKNAVGKNENTFKLHSRLAAEEGIVEKLQSGKWRVGSSRPYTIGDLTQQ